MRTIVTAITAAALALSLTFQAAPANAAVPGYDSSYAGESAFLNLDQGDDGSFTVFFANTGTTTWTAGSATQVDLAACLEDKVTCNQQDADEATFNDGWLSATRYATHTQTSVAPGQIGTFTYNVTVPADAAEDTFRFNGALVLASTGADIHNEGYFQDVTTGTPPTEGAATLTELDPDEGSIEGGTNVIITGEDFDCDGITVNFGDAEADVVSCGETSLTVETPAAAEASGDQEVDVTATNAGAEASNALTFIYRDDVAPTFDSISVTGQQVTLTFSEPVCVDLDDDMAQGDEFTIRVNGTASGVTADDIEFADCDDDEFATTATTTITAPTITEGDEISLTITTDGAAQVVDEGDTSMERATTRSTEAEADVTRPTVESATISSFTRIEVVASEPLDCTGIDAGDFTWTSDDDADEEDEAASTATCDDDEITLTFAAGMFDEAETGELAFDGGTDDVQDLSGNDMADFTVEVTELESDPPLIDDAALTTSAGFSSTADSGDVVTLELSEAVEAIVSGSGSTNTGDVVRVTDEDGTIVDLTCTTGGPDTDTSTLSVECTLDSARDTLTLRLLEGVVSDADVDTNAIADGDVPGLQWPSTIIDTSGITDDEDNDPDLANSDDIVIDDE